jgi:dTDP-4-dehydrorhamnose reductase
MLITRRLLGRALYAQLCTDYPSSGGHAVIGWCGQRSHGNDFRSVDLTHESAIVAALNDAQPDVIVHSAAIRRPDAIKNDELLAQNVNVMAVRVIAEHVRAHAGVMLFISTDYVFDGVHPPFDERAPTCPLNEYGVQKVIGERLVQDTTGGLCGAPHTHTLFNRCWHHPASADHVRPR